jgi:hypothetical protein
MNKLWPLQVLEGYRFVPIMCPQHNHHIACVERSEEPILAREPGDQSRSSLTIPTTQHSVLTVQLCWLSL